MDSKQKRISRKDAKARGLNKYDGICKSHGKTKFYVSFGCIPCCRERSKRYRRLHQEEYNKNQTLYREKNRDRDRGYKRKWVHNNPKASLLLKIKEKGKCFYCRKKYHKAAMEFDHFRGKTMWLSTTTSMIRGLPSVLRKSVSLEDVKQELKNVRLTCSNCHKIKTNLIDCRKGKYKEEGEREWRRYLSEIRKDIRKEPKRTQRRSKAVIK